MKFRKRRSLTLKKKTGWSWERMCRQMHMVMGTEGPSHTTLFRYTDGTILRPNKLTERWIEQAVVKLEKQYE